MYLTHIKYSYLVIAHRTGYMITENLLDGDQTKDRKNHKLFIFWGRFSYRKYVYKKRCKVKENTGNNKN